MTFTQACILYPLSAFTSYCKKEKIHRINVPENIVVIKKSVASSRAPPKNARPYSLKSAQLTCRREHGVLIHYRPRLHNGHLFCEAAFRSRRPTAVLAVVPRLWLDLKPTQAAGSQTVADKIWTKGAVRSSFQHEIGALGLFTHQPEAPNFPRCPAVHQPYRRWYHLASRGEWLSDCWA